MSSSDRLPIVIFGCGGHGRVVADTLKVARGPVAGFLDDRPPAAFVSEIPLLGGRGCLEEPGFLKNYDILIALGEARLRRQLELSPNFGDGLKIRRRLEARQKCR